ncbi:hypothetical protein, partial [Paracraurococcus ruber]|nr:hypothetical protein [Paracraurococcus ruber]
GEASGAVAAAVATQRDGVRSVAEGARAAAEGVGEAVAAIAAVARESDTAQRLSQDAERLSARTDARVAEMRAGMIVTLRDSLLGDGRTLPKVPVCIPARLLPADGGAPLPTTLLEVSDVGAMLRLTDAAAAAAAARCPPGRAVALGIDGIGDLPADIRQAGGTALHLRLRDTAPAAARAALASLLTRVAEADARFGAAAQQAAARIEAAFAAALAAGEITEEALFDTAYAPIPGTDPPQVMARFTTLTDRLLPPIQEPLLGFDPRVVFCAAVDRNGYLPTHNLAVSQPQRPDDPVWNAAHCRNRRIFNDRAGLAAGRNRRPLLVQSYERDMGGGRLVPMKEADAPIAVRGRHWGGLRLAFRAD